MWHEVAKNDSRVSLWCKQVGKAVRKRDLVKYLGIDLEMEKKENMDGQEKK